MSSYAGYGTSGSAVPNTKVAGYNQVARPTMDPRSMAYRQDYLDRADPGIRGGLDRYARIAAGDESEFEGIQNRAFEDFNRALGQIGSRYAGVGAGQMSARRSSAFQNDVTGAAGDLAATLQAQRLDLQRNALNELLGLSKTLLSQSPYEYGYVPKQRKRKWYETLFGAAAPVAGAVAGGVFGGPAGAAFGSQIGSSFGSQFLE